MHTVAYLDANSGSLIAGAFAAGFAGIAVVFKMGWQRLLTFFSPKRRRAAAQRAAEVDSADSNAA